MFRRTSMLVALISVTLASIGSDAHACGGRGRYSLGNRPSVRYSRPVVRTVVQPTMVVRPTAVQKVVVAPQPAKPQPPTVPAGSTLTLPANFLGSQPGSVFMVFGNIKLPVEVRRWEPTGVTITLPPMAIKTAVEIRVDVVLPDGKLGMTRQLRVTKPASVVVHPTAPTSPLPTQNAIQQTSRQPIPTQPVAVSPLAGQRQPVQPQVGTPIILPSAQPPQQGQPQVGSPIILPNPPAADDIETNPILQEHLENDQPNAEDAPAGSSETPAANSPFSMISQLING